MYIAFHPSLSFDKTGETPRNSHLEASVLEPLGLLFAVQKVFEVLARWGVAIRAQCGACLIRLRAVFSIKVRGLMAWHFHVASFPGSLVCEMAVDKYQEGVGEVGVGI